MYELLLWALVTLSFSGAVGLAACVVALAYGRFYWDDGEHTGARKSMWFLDGRAWPRLRRYFSAEVRAHPKVHGIPDDARVLFAQYPHGFSPFPLGTVIAAPGDSPLARFRDRLFVGGASAIAWVPGLRDFCLACGYVDVGRESLVRFCTKERPDAHLGLSPGGMREMARARRGRDDLYLGHSGFLALAVQAKFDYVVPVYVEKQTDAFLCASWFLGLRDWTLTHFGVPLPSFVVPIPLPVACTVHVGKPVAVANDYRFAHNVADSLLKAVRKVEDPQRVRIWTSRETCLTLYDARVTPFVRSAFAHF